MGLAAGGDASVKEARLGKVSSAIAPTVHATGLPEDRLGQVVPTRSSEGAPEGFSWSRAVAVPALGSVGRVGIEEQAGRKTAEFREREVSQQFLVGDQQTEGACNSREGFSAVAEGRPGACISREGSSSVAEGRQYREGFPPGEGSVALPAGVHCRSQRRGGFWRTSVAQRLSERFFPGSGETARVALGAKQRHASSWAVTSKD